MKPIPARKRERVFHNLPASRLDLRLLHSTMSQDCLAARRFGIIVSLMVAGCVAGKSQIATTTTLSSSQTPLGVSLPLTLTAVVSPAPPSGKVTFYDRTTVLATADLDASGSASLTTVALLPGAHHLRARYWGSSTSSRSTSGYLLQEIWSGRSTGLVPGQIGYFAPEPFQFPTPSIVTADFKGDGFMDFAVTLTYGGFAVFLGKGDGTFQTPVFYNNPGLLIQSLVAGDIRGTGRQDLIAASYDEAGFTLFIQRFWNNGDGTFSKGPDLPLPNSKSVLGSIQVADMNGDGRPDLIFMGFNIGFYVFLGDGDGQFQGPIATMPALESYLPQFAIADFNRDGKPDVAFTGSNALSQAFVTVLPGNGDGGFQDPVEFAIPLGGVGEPLVTGDFNRDGKVDLALSIETTSLNSPSVQTFLGNGDGTFQPPWTDPLGLSYQFLLAADMNGDGIPDLVGTTGYPWVLFLYGVGDGTFQPLKEFAFVNPILGGSALAVGDFNGDGLMDVVAVGATRDCINRQCNPIWYFQVLLGTN